MSQKDDRNKQQRFVSILSRFHRYHADDDDDREAVREFQLRRSSPIQPPLIFS
jgi:hypothetical protein